MQPIPVRVDAASPDGQFALLTRGSSKVEVLELSTGLQLDVLRGHTDLLNSARFSPDGKLIVTASRDGTARVSSCDLCGSVQELLELAQRRLQSTRRQFTEEERLKYLPANPTAVVSK